MQDILAAISTILSGLPQGILAMSFGFSSVSMGLGLLVGGLINLFLKVNAPISFQAETITLVGTIGEDKQERISIIFYSSLIIFILGLLGVLEQLIDFIGPAITTGMIAGVGILLARVSLNLFNDDKLIAGSSILVGFILHMLFDDLLITLLGSVFISSVISFIKNKGVYLEDKKEKLEFNEPTFNFNILRGSLAVACLNIGSNIAFGTMTAGFSGANINIDHLSILNGASNIASSLLGGGPLGTIISITGEAPNPVRSATIMMFIMGIILLIGFLPRIAKYIPSQSIAGFLFVLGTAVTFPENALASLSASIPGGPLVGGATLAVTAISDPFIGMMTGIIFKIFIR